VKSVKSVIHRYRPRARTLCHLSIDEIKCVCGREWRTTDFTDHTDRKVRKGLFPAWPIRTRIGRLFGWQLASVSNLAQPIDFALSAKNRDPDLSGGDQTARFPRIRRI
jgi:hypothetical protein